MRTQTRAGAVLLAGVLAGSSYGVTLTQQQGAQDNSNQQQNKDSKKKKNDQQSTNANNAQPNTAQPANNPPPNNPASNSPSGDKPTPLFGGTIGLKSSRQTKDSATLGFNGVDPNGQVQKAMLGAGATPADAMKAQQMAQITITAADLAQFLQDGGLNPDAAPQKP